MNEQIKHTTDFLRVLRSNGKYAFTLDALINEVPKSVKNIRNDLDRLREKGEIINIRKGFYTLLPIEYQSMGAIPVEFYIDDLMDYLSKKYYVGLFSASMFHGAAHQQPQEYFVISEAPKPRKIVNEHFIINFSEKKHFAIHDIESKKTETGYFNISGPALTFLDLIYFEKTIGGYNRIITVLMELMEVMSIGRMREAVKNQFPVSTFQRAGYIADYHLSDKKLANIFESKLAKSKPRTILLKSSGAPEGVVDNKWKVIVNVQIDSDL